jgi:HSP20 family protein
MGRDAFNFLPLFLPAGAVGRQPEWQPSADVYRTRKGWLVKFDLAGVRPQDMELSVQDNTLTIRGLRRDCLTEEGCRHYRMEITYAHFERCIELSGDLTRAQITTEHREGMLIVRIQWE